MEKATLKKQLASKKAYLEQIKIEMYGVAGQIQLLEELTEEKSGE